MKYLYKEAFCLMIYHDEVTGERETIWNSRDGITPFCATSRASNTSHHTDWRSDRCVPDHTPSIGDRVFVDLTRERAVESREAYVEKWWNREVRGCRMSDQWPTKEQAIAELVAADLDEWGGHPPDLIVVDEAFLECLRVQRRAS